MDSDPGGDFPVTRRRGVALALAAALSASRFFCAARAAACVPAYLHLPGMYEWGIGELPFLHLAHAQPTNLQHSESTQEGDGVPTPSAVVSSE